MLLRVLYSDKKTERVMGIEPTYPAWKAGVLPLNYTRISVILFSTKIIISQVLDFGKHFLRDFQQLSKIPLYLIIPRVFYKTQPTEAMKARTRLL